MNIGSNSSENTAIPEWVYVEQIAYSGIIALIGIPGNILIILVFAHSHEKTTTDYMVFSMAISDLLGSCVCTTLNILRHIPILWAKIGSKWFCRAYDFLALYTLIVSSWILGVVAFDRYLKVCRPFSEVFTVSRIKMLCITVYIIVTVFSATSLAVERFDHSTGACLIIESRSVWSIFIYIVAFLTLSSYIITGISYTRVALALCARLRMKLKRSHGTEEITSGNKNESSTGQVNLASISSTANSIHLDNIEVNVTGKQTSAVDSYNAGQKLKGQHKGGLLQEQRKVNRTTMIMFVITMLNISSFVLVFVGNALAENKLYLPDDNVREILGHTIRTSYLMSYIANPLLYIMMSSRFRERVRSLFTNLRQS